MGKRFAICAVIIFVLITLGILAYANLEIYPRQVPVFPSRDVIANDYFALERWLAKTGHPVRVEKRGNLFRIVSGAEKTVFIRASACAWENAETILMPWIERGGFLVISLEYDFYDNNLTGFLAGLGITEDDYTSEESENNDQQETADTLTGAGDPSDNPAEAAPVPDFDRSIRFFIDKTKTADAGAGIFTIKDESGDIRLARFPLGEGALVVIGSPLFMFNRHLEREINARLAWDLTGGRASAENPGLLFIREKRVTKGLFGKIADRGNFFPLAASALILIILGFWMVIPVFGLVFSERQSRARPIRERFLAEIRFLKKYNALQSYLETYIRELKLRGRENDIAEIEDALQPDRHGLSKGKTVKYRDIINGLRKLESLTERL
jgi:hypothetical protein